MYIYSFWSIVIMNFNSVWLFDAYQTTAERLDFCCSISITIGYYVLSCVIYSHAYYDSLFRFCSRNDMFAVAERKRHIYIYIYRSRWNYLWLPAVKHNWKETNMIRVLFDERTRWRFMRKHRWCMILNLTDIFWGWVAFNLEESFCGGHLWMIFWIKKRFDFAYLVNGTFMLG